MTPDQLQLVLTVAGTVVAIILLVVGFFVVGLLPILFRARRAGVRITLVELVGMRFRKVDPRVVVDGAVELAGEGVAIPWGDIETHYLAGGRVGPTVRAYIEARRVDSRMLWGTICALDLAHREPSAEDIVSRIGLGEPLRGDDIDAHLEGLAARRQEERPGWSIVGTRGVAATDINLLGFAMLAGERVGVVSLDAAIDAGEPVRVVLSEGNLIGVRRDA